MYLSEEFTQGELHTKEVQAYDEDGTGISTCN